MRFASRFAVLVLVLPLTLPFTILPAEAQLGHGNRRGGGAFGGSPGGEDSARAGKYGLTATDVMEALDAGDGRQALEAYEKAAKEAESQGNLALAVAAYSSASLAALRLSVLPRAIADATRATDLASRARG